MNLWVGPDLCKVRFAVLFHTCLLGGSILLPGTKPSILRSPHSGVLILCMKNMKSKGDEERVSSFYSCLSSRWQIQVDMY